MEKKIQDTKTITQYLPFYLECEVQKGKEIRLLKGVLPCEKAVMLSYDEKGVQTVGANQIKLRLRPLSSMTDEEMLEYARIERPETTQVKLMGDKVWSFYDPNDGSFYKWSTHSLKHPIPEQTRYVLSRGFDLFGLIEAGLAIDKTLHPSPFNNKLTWNKGRKRNPVGYVIYKK